jgi:DNA-directed RNA polymerase subunit RPC12/RpoP
MRAEPCAYRLAATAKVRIGCEETETGELEMEGARVLILIVSAATWLVMLLAQLRLFAIATTLEQLLRQLGSNLPIGGNCPHCGGRLVAGRPVCRHCGRDVPVQERSAPADLIMTADGLAVCGTCGYHLARDGSKLCKCPDPA